MLDRLQQGNIAAALTAITNTAQPKYQALFTQLGSSLSATMAGLGTPDSVTLAEDFADLLITRNMDGETYGYRVLLMRDGDGIWRIDDM